MIFDLFSKRQRRARGEVPDVFQYEVFPTPLRRQIVMIWKEAWLLSGTEDPYTMGAYGCPDDYPEHIVKILRKEYGLFRLLGHDCSWDLELFGFFLNTQETDKALDCVELGFKSIDILRENDNYRKRVRDADFVAELNGRMKEAGFGFRYESGTLLRIDAEHLHTEAVKPALNILSAIHFAGANAEFRSAHEHYRHGRYKECLVDCLKCFESTMKSVCDRQGWSYPSNAAASKLVDVLLTNGLLPAFSQTQLAAVRLGGSEPARPWASSARRR